LHGNQANTKIRSKKQHQKWPQGKAACTRRIFMHFQTPVTHPAIELLTSNKPSRPLRMSTVAIALGLSLLLSACANIQALMGIEKKPAPSGRVIPVLDELWSIRFQPDLDDEDTPVIQGKILIQK